MWSNEQHDVAINLQAQTLVEIAVLSHLFVSRCHSFTSMINLLKRGWKGTGSGHCQSYLEIEQYISDENLFKVQHFKISAITEFLVFVSIQPRISFCQNVLFFILSV